MPLPLEEGDIVACIDLSLFFPFVHLPFSVLFGGFSGVQTSSVILSPTPSPATYLVFHSFVCLRAVLLSLFSVRQEKTKERGRLPSSSSSSALICFSRVRFLALLLADTVACLLHLLAVCVSFSLFEVVSLGIKFAWNRRRPCNPLVPLEDRRGAEVAAPGAPTTAAPTTLSFSHPFTTGAPEEVPAERSTTPPPTLATATTNLQSRATLTTARQGRASKAKIR